MRFIEKYWILFGIAYLAIGFINPSLCLLIIGIILLYFGITTINKLWRFQKRGVQCSATILSYEPDEERYKTPVVQFTTAEGTSVKDKPWVYVSSALSKIRIYSENPDQAVQVIYNPDHPEEFVLKSEKEFNYLMVIILIAGGLFSTGFALSALLGFMPGLF